MLSEFLINYLFILFFLRSVFNVTDVVAKETYQLQTKRSIYYYYLLGKGGFVFGGVGLSVCLFVFLSVDITQQVMDGLG